MFIGERISRNVKMEHLIVSRDGAIYRNQGDKSERRPVDLATYIYIQAEWTVRDIALVKDIEVYHDHARMQMRLVVELQDGRSLSTVLNEDEATAPDHQRALVADRIRELRKEIWRHGRFPY